MNLFKIIPYFIGFVFICTICSWIFLGYLTVKLGGEIDSNGLKSVVEHVWEGENKK